METQTTENEVSEDSLFNRLLERVKTALPALFKPTEASSFTVFKGADGQYYWHTRHSNNFKDKDQEILSEKAHLAFETRVDMGLVPMPELWSWHTGGTRQGQAKMLFYDNHIMNAIGTFDNTPEGETARKFYEANVGKIELSHGFTFPKWAFKDGIYEVYNTFEISTLPIGAAANPYTTFEEIKAMALSEEKRQWLEQTIGKERTDQLLSENEKMGKAIEELGANYKDFADVPANAETETPAEETPENPATEEKPKPDVTAFAQLLSDILEGQGHILEVVEGQGKAIKAQNDALVKSQADNATLKSELDKLRAEMALTPRRASEAPETNISKELAEKIIGTPKQETDSFWNT